MLDKTFSLRAHVARLFDKEASEDGVIAELLAQSNKNLDLRNALMLIGAKQAIRTYFNDSRTEAQPIRGARSEAPPPERDSKESRASITETERQERQAAKENRRLLWDSYSLYGRQLLRDAMADDIRLSIIMRQGQVAGANRAIGFEQALLGEMKSPNKTCAQQLKPKKVDELWMRFYGR